MKPIYIIIPTFNNIEMLVECIRSITANTVSYYKFIIVNNGAEELNKYIGGDIKIVHTGKNLGWMGGINAGLKAIDEPCDYVVFMNDDTLILPHHYDWLDNMKSVLDSDETVGAVGPSSNVVAGWQNIRHKNLPNMIEVKFLIGFCVMHRKKLIEEIGGLDESLPGGDDFDWSIDIRKKGYKLIARRDTFVFHHGFVTGTRVHGGPEQEKGWNSPGMTEATNIAIIRKHGFKQFVETTRNECLSYDTMVEEYGDDGCLMKIAKGDGLDIGCGFNKITPNTTGVDLVAKGDEIGKHGGSGGKSVADVRASGDDLYMFDDSSQDYIVARHNLEHYANPVKTLKEWGRVLKFGGKLGITMPDDAVINGMRLDSTHKHSFNRECIKDLLELTGFKVLEVGGTANQWDFYVIAEKKMQYKFLTTDVQKGVEEQIKREAEVA